VIEKLELIASIATNIREAAEKESVSCYTISQIDRLMSVIDKTIADIKLEAEQWAGK